MKNNTGHWFLLEESPSILMLEGPPKPGDIVRIDIDDNNSLFTGRVRRAYSTYERTDKYSSAEEQGMDFIFSPLF